MTDSFVNNPTVIEKYGLVEGKTFEEQFSTVSLENILFFVTATAVWMFGSELLNAHKTGVENMLAQLKPHTLRWYVNKAKYFRYGQPLIAESDLYDDTGLTDEQITQMQVVKHAAAVEGGTDVFLLRIKTAGESGDELRPLTTQELEALRAYFAQVKDAGVNLTVTSGTPDDLIGNIRVYYDPMLLSSTGASLSDGGEPVKDSINNYLKNLPFDGVFSIMALTDAVQAVAGVKIVQVMELKSRYGTAAYTIIEDKIIPDAGYLRVASWSASVSESLKIRYLPYE